MYLYPCPPGFAGRSNLEAAWIDAYADQFKDYMEYIRPFYRAAMGGRRAKVTDEEKEELKKKFPEPNRDNFFGALERVAKVTDVVSALWLLSHQS